jgi:catechol 2,3-dioxygenase-like lactoylglutathione lyase family enzyme
MDLYLVELTVADWPASVAWYRDRLGLAVERLDEAHWYALLSAGPGRIALKAGTASPGNTKLVIHVADLGAEVARLHRAGIVPAGPMKSSAEGYRSVPFVDPDGHRVEIFEWANPDPGSGHQTCYSDSLRPPAPRG